MSTETITVSCPALIPSSMIGYERIEAYECAGENEVEIAFGWDPGQDGGTTDPSWSAHVEDVEVPAITCEWCGHVFTDAEREAVAKSFEPREDDGGYDGPDTIDEWNDPHFNYDINGRCAP